MKSVSGECMSFVELGVPRRFRVASSAWWLADRTGPLFEERSEERDALRPQQFASANCLFRGSLGFAQSIHLATFASINDAIVMIPSAVSVTLQSIWLSGEMCMTSSSGRVWCGASRNRAPRAVVDVVKEFMDRHQIALDHAKENDVWRCPLVQR